MNISPATKSMVLEEMGHANADINRIARQYGIPVRIIRQITGVPRVPATFAEKFGGFGRPELQPTIVSRTMIGQPWPDALDQNKADYDAGLVEM